MRKWSRQVQRQPEWVPCELIKGWRTQTSGSEFSIHSLVHPLTMLMLTSYLHAFVPSKTSSTVFAERLPQWKWKSPSRVWLFVTPESYSPWDSPGQNAGVGSLSLLQRIFPTQGSKPGLPHCRRILYQLSHQRSPRILEWVAYPFSSGSSQPRNQTGVSCIAGGFFTNWAIREAPVTGIQFARSWGVGMPKNWRDGYEGRAVTASLPTEGSALMKYFYYQPSSPAELSQSERGRTLLASLAGQDIAGLPFLISGNTS